MVTVYDALKKAACSLSAVSDEAENEAKIIVSHLLGVEPLMLSFCNKEVDERKLEKMICRRKKGEPLQYILGKWWFYEGEFFVGKGVLIPRQDTENLVEAALEELKDKKNASVADLCAGSGAIGISIGNKRQDISVVCLEKYQKALKFLNKNIEHNKAFNVKAVKADVLKKPFGSYDLIVSNPPYISKSEMKALSKEVKKEPETALFGGKDGLDFYRKITRNWKKALNPEGTLMFEIGKGQDEAVYKILKSEGFYKIGFKKDIPGVQRVIFGTVKNV